MTKYNDIMMKGIEKWFEHNKVLTKHNYDVIRDVAQEVLK